MSVKEALLARRAIRSFAPTPVERDVVEDLLETAARAPSGGNLQPWKVHVLTGDSLLTLKREAENNFSFDAPGEKPEHLVYPPNLEDPYRSRRRDLGEQMYQVLGVPRNDREGKLEQLKRNFEFFGAPVGLFFVLDKDMEPIQWTDLGFFIQSICLLATEMGLGTCPQGFWATMPETVRHVIGLEDHEIVVCGMALGYINETADINRFRSERAILGEIALFHD
jgi:nitroreductase